MKRTIKLLTIAIVMLIAILGFTNTSNAVNWGYLNKNDVVKVSGKRDYDERVNLFCLRCGQHLDRDNPDGIPYKVSAVIDINGSKATDGTKTIDNWWNTKMAYIYTGGYSWEAKQQATWRNMRDWIVNVGVNFDGLYSDYAYKSTSTIYSAGNALNSWADNMANNYKGNDALTDNTDKSKVTVEAYEKDGNSYMRIGPFKWSFGGTVTDVKVYDQDNKEISTKLYSSYSGTNENFFNIGDIKSGSEFYISVPIDGNVQKISKISGTIRQEVPGVKMWFLENPYGNNYQNLAYVEPHSSTQDIPFEIDEDIPTTGKVKIVKVNKDNHECKLAGVSFIIKYEELNKYVRRDDNGKISYVDDESMATEFITDTNGEISIDNLVVGTYTAYEKDNPNYGYEFLEEGQTIEITAGDTVEKMIENKQRWVKLSGYVWLDKIFGKQSERNDLYKDNDYDSDDILMDGISVRVMDSTTGEVAKDKNGNPLEATTADGGAYLFVDVEIDKLKDYYIEFEYDGLTYTNVVPHIDKDNGSKAAENAETRANFNKAFSTVEGNGGALDTGITLDESGNKKNDLSYTINETEHTSTLINNGQFPITAQTTETGYNIIDHFTYGQEEIKNNNLGLYEREQPDLALIKDIQNVRVGVNGYQHVYEYAERFKNQGEYGDGFNVGVKFGNKYGKMKYTRAIYKSDYDFTLAEDNTKELKVYITYRIQIKNESSNLITQVNNLVDYYDARYTLTQIGNSIDEHGGVAGDAISHTETDYNTDYKKTTIDTNVKINPQESTDVYVEFELNRELVAEILNDAGSDGEPSTEALDNVVEINSYSTFDSEGNIYAGIDKDSNPGNAVPGDEKTYQDDTDKAPSLQLEVASARSMSGSVFLDETSGELMTGKVRQGNGIFDDGEKGIQGVEITLTENSGSGKIYTATTDENGNYTITDYIPGDYTLTYTWGDDTYTVQKYKGTIYQSSRDQTNKQWYKDDVDTRYTDAIDNYETRQKIDDELKTINYDINSKITITKMDSSTPEMGIGVEYDADSSVYTIADGDMFVQPGYEIKNVDFGIVERARQQMGLAKRVKGFKITLANGQVVTDATIDENGNLSGQTDHLIYMKPSETTDPKNGFVRAELDNELIQGSTLEVTYELKATNESELDYLSENYYKYGIIEGEPVTITPSKIIDYLDKDWSFDESKNSDWQVKSLDDIKSMVAEAIYNDSESEVNNRTIIYTEKLNSTPLKPTESGSVDLLVSKVLSTAEDISLNNEAEITEITKTGGGKPDPTPGNYVPGTGYQETPTEPDDGQGETVIVTPATGANLNFIVPIAIGVTALIVLGVGVFLIKRKAVDKDE